MKGTSQRRCERPLLGEIMYNLTRTHLGGTLRDKGERGVEWSEVEEGRVGLDRIGVN